MIPTSNTPNLFHILSIYKPFFALDSSEENLSFLIKIGVSLKLDKWKMHICLLCESKTIQNSALLLCFSLQDDIFIYCMAEMSKKLRAKKKIAFKFKFLFYFKYIYVCVYTMLAHNYPYGVDKI